MPTIRNYSMAGIGPDVQYGKGGGRIVFDTGNTEFKVTTKDGATLARLQAATPTQASDVTTKEYVDSLSAGLDPKESVAVATTADLGATYSAVAGTGGTGGFTLAPNLVDGVTLVDGQRVLVKDQTVATENGIYTVVTAGTGADGVWERAQDQDGSPSHEVSAGNFTFVEGGTANGATGWVTQGSGILALNTDNVVWVQFSEAGQIATGPGLSLSGNTVSLDFTQGLSAVTAEGADEIAIYDSSAGTMARTTITDMINALDVVQGISANGFVARTTDDAYASRTFQAGDGLAWTNADGVAGDPSIALDFAGLATVTAPADGSQELLVNNAGTIEKVTFNQLIADKDLVTAAADGILVRTAAGTYASRSIVNGGGLAVTNADGVAGDISVALDFTGVAANGVDGIDGAADTLVMYNASTLAHETVTFDDIGNFVASNFVSPTSITEGDTSVTVSDTGTGTVTVTVDGNEAGVWTASGLQVDQLTASNLAAGRVTFAGTNGLLTDDAAFTFDDVTGRVSSTIVTGATVEASNLTSGRVVLAGAAGQLVDDANFMFDGATLTVTGAGDFSGNVDVGGDLTVTGNISTTAGTLSAAGLQDTTLTVDGGLVFTDATGDFNQAAGLVFDSTNNKVDIDLVGGLDVNDIGMSGNTITTLQTNQDLILAPNGTGEVVIGGGGAGSITADTGESLVIEAGENTGIQLGGDVVISGGQAVDGTAGSVELRGGTATGTSGTNGTIKLIDGNGNLVIEIADHAAGAANNVEFEAADAGSNPTFRAAGTDTNIGLTLQTKGNGLVKLVSDSGDVTADITASGDADVVANKGYVDAQVAGAAVPGAVGSLSAAVDFTAAGQVVVGTIPAGATVLRTTMRVDTVADAAATLLVEDSTAAEYMSVDENDPEVSGVYFNSVLAAVGGSDVTASFTVAPNSATVGSGTLVIEYRNA